MVSCRTKKPNSFSGPCLGQLFCYYHFKVVCDTLYYSLRMQKLLPKEVYKHFTTVLLQLQTIPNQFWNIYIFFFKREYHRHIVQFHSLIKTSRASYRLHISILFCLMISWTPEGRFFPLFESFTNRRKTRGKEKRRGNENRWYLDLNNPQLILRKYHTSGTRNKPVVAVAAVAEFYGTRFPFLSPFVAFLLRFSVVL